MQRKNEKGTVSPFLLLTVKELVENIIRNALKDSHLFLVEANVRPNKIDVYLDGDMGVNIQECARISHQLHKELEEKGIDTGNIYIDVSSPGIDREFKQLRDYKKNVGRKLQVRNSQNKIYTGYLVYIDTEKIILKSDKANKSKIETLYFSTIREAKVSF